MNFREELGQMLDKNEGYLCDFQLQEFSESLRENREEIPLLYRYTCADYYNIRNFETGKLFLSNIGYMNDIFEGLADCFDDKTIGCTESLSDYPDDALNAYVEKLSDIVYLKSFSESENDLYMWAIYAESCKGMCIQYDLRNMHGAEDYYSYLFPVHYMTERYKAKSFMAHLPEYFDSYKHGDDDAKFNNAEFLCDITAPFLSKAACWKAEKEWRLIAPYIRMNIEGDLGCKLEDADHDENYTIKDKIINFPYATCVYLGPRMETSKKDHLKEIAFRKGNIRVIETRIALEEYKLEMREVTKDGVEAWHA